MSETATRSKVVGVGSVVEHPYIRVVFQSGLPQEAGINGCRVDEVIAVAMERIEEYQNGPLACPENEEALEHLKCALGMLERRRERRMAQGVFNTHLQHEVHRTEDEDEDFSATSC